MPKAKTKTFGKKNEIEKEKLLSEAALAQHKAALAEIEK